MSRFEEVVNDAIGEVVLTESPFRAETLARDIAELVRGRQGAERAEVTVQARYPEHKPAPVSGVVDAGDLHAPRPRRGAGGGRHAPHGGGLRDGDHRLPLRAGARRGACARAPLRAGGLLRRADRAHPRRGAGRHAQPARPWHAAHRLPGGQRSGDRREDAAGDRRGLDVLGDLRADEARRRGGGRREGPPPPPLRRGLRARDGRGRVAAFPGLDGASFISARQENLETIHVHNVVAERHGLLAELRGEIDSGLPASHQTTLEEWLNDGAWGAGRVGRSIPPPPRGRLRPSRPSLRSPRLWLRLASAGAGQRRSRAPRAPSRAPSHTAAARPTAVCPAPRSRARIAAICMHVLTLPNMLAAITTPAWVAPRRSTVTAAAGDDHHRHPRRQPARARRARAARRRSAACRRAGPSACRKW